MIRSLPAEGWKADLRHLRGALFVPIPRGIAGKAGYEVKNFKVICPFFAAQGHRRPCQRLGLPKASYRLTAGKSGLGITERLRILPIPQRARTPRVECQHAMRLSYAERRKPPLGFDSVFKSDLSILVCVIGAGSHAKRHCRWMLSLPKVELAC